MRAIFLPFLVLFAFGVSLAAFGKVVTIEWQPETDVSQYELEIRLGDQVVLNRRLPPSESSWKGNLPAGSYAYRLRSFDAKARAGLWSDYTPFSVAVPPVVKPPSPSPTPPPVVPVETPKPAPKPAPVVTPAPPPSPVSSKPPKSETKSDGPILNLAVGVLGGQGYLFPSLTVQAAVVPWLALGVRGVHSSSGTSTSSASVSGLSVTAAGFFDGKTFLGPFVELGAGVYSFSANNPLGNESGRGAFGGQAVVGWQFRPASGGLTFSVSAGVQYIAKPNLSVLTFGTVGVKPLGVLFVGYAF